MAEIKVLCPYCGSDNIVKYGKNSTGKQRMLCRNPECRHKTFQLEYENYASKPGTKEKIVEMAMNGSGVRDTSRVLKISPVTVIEVLKKQKKFAEPVNKKYLENIDKVKEIDIAVYPVISAEMDEMWSFYHDKKHQIWLWWAVEHETNIPLAYTFGTREHKYLDKLLDLLKPFPIRTVYADNNFAYENKIKDKVLIRGKKNTQKIERNHLTLRTRLKRLARKTICFSKDKDIHQSVIGTFINIYFFGRKFNVSTIL